MMLFLLGLALGTVYDIAGVLFVQAISTKSPLRAAGVSMALGGLSLSGIGTALTSGWGCAGVIVGYGLGTYAGVRWLTPS
jgi:hypothetical protein